MPQPPRPTEQTTTEPVGQLGGAGLDLPSLNLMLEALNSSSTARSRRPPAPARPRGPLPEDIFFFFFCSLTVRYCSVQTSRVH